MVNGTAKVKQNSEEVEDSSQLHTNHTYKNKTKTSLKQKNPHLSFRGRISPPIYSRVINAVSLLKISLGREDGSRGRCRTSAFLKEQWGEKPRTMRAV